MKWTTLIVILGSVYSLTGCDDAKKTPPTPPAQPTATPAAQPAHTNALKAPIDKARDTFQKIKKQNEEGGI